MKTVVKNFNDFVCLVGVEHSFFLTRKAGDKKVECAQEK